MLDVISCLERLDKLLVAADLGQFVLFNKAYLIVTRSIQQAIREDYFKNPAFIEKFIVNFASYYFQAVNLTVSDDVSLSLPWAKLNEYATQKSAPVFISLLLGANAHINNDLPQVLVKLLGEEKGEGLLKDLVKIDKLLMKSGRQIIGVFDEKNSFLDFLKRRLQFTYYRPAMYTILYWRIRAWQSYRLLKRNEHAMPSVTRKTIGTANRLLKIAKILG